MASKRTFPRGQFFRRSPGVFTFLNDTTHDLVPSDRVKHDAGCLRIVPLCAYAPDGVVCGFDFEIVGKHTKFDHGWLGCWIEEYDQQKDARLPVHFELVHRLPGILVFEHPFGCTFAVTSEIPKPLLELLNGS